MSFWSEVRETWAHHRMLKRTEKLVPACVDCVVHILGHFEVSQEELDQLHKREHEKAGA